MPIRWLRRKVFSRGHGVDAVIITASTKSSEPMRQAAHMCRKRGRIVLVGRDGDWNFHVLISMKRNSLFRSPVPMDRGVMTLNMRTRGMTTR